MRGLKGCAGVVAVLLASAIAFGQGSSTSLQGTITDPSGSAIAGANILLVNDGSKIERTTNTDPRGEYRLLALPPGTYRLTVNFKGFSQYVQTGLQLLVNTKRNRLAITCLNCSYAKSRRRNAKSSSFARSRAFSM